MVQTVAAQRVGVIGAKRLRVACRPCPSQGHPHLESPFLGGESSAGKTPWSESAPFPARFPGDPAWVVSPTPMRNLAAAAVFRRAQPAEWCWPAQRSAPPRWSGGVPVVRSLRRLPLTVPMALMARRSTASEAVQFPPPLMDPLRGKPSYACRKWKEARLGQARLVGCARLFPNRWFVGRCAPFLQQWPD